MSLITLSDNSADELPDVELPESQPVSGRHANRTSKGKRLSSCDRPVPITKKQMLLEARVAKQTAAALSKMYKPGECMKFMYIEMGPELSGQWYMSDVRREVTSLNAHIDITPNVGDTQLLTWSRRGLQNEKMPGAECNKGLLVLEAQELASLVRSRGLAGRATRRGTDVTLAVLGTRDYFKSSSRKKKSTTIEMTEIELEMAITDLLITSGVDTVLVNSPNDLALVIVQMTKAIAEGPYKKAKHASDEQADFFMRGDNKKTVAVDKDGIGLSRVWQQMVAVLPHSSLEAARAIVGKYPSPLTLYECLQDPEGVQEVAELEVVRAGGVGVRGRRVGPEFSRRLRSLFTEN